MLGVRNDLFKASRFRECLCADSCCDEVGDELWARFLLLCVAPAAIDASELSGLFCQRTWSFGVAVDGAQLKASSVLAMRSSMGIRTAGVCGMLCSGELLCQTEVISSCSVLLARFSIAWFSFSSSPATNFSSNANDLSFFLDCEEMPSGAEGIMLRRWRSTGHSLGKERQECRIAKEMVK